MLGELGQRRQIVAGNQHDDRAGALAGPCVGNTDHDHVGNRRVLAEDVLDLSRGKVLRVADDDVFQSPRDPHVAVLVDQAEVAGAEVTVVVEGLEVEG